MNRDVVFDEMVNWYPPLKIVEDGEAKNGDVPSKVEQESQLISEPQESSISGFSNTPWKGKLRSLSIVDGSFQTSSRNLHVDDESCRNPTLAKCGREAQHLEKVGIGVVATVAFGLRLRQGG